LHTQNAGTRLAISVIIIKVSSNRRLIARNVKISFAIISISQSQTFGSRRCFEKHQEQCKVDWPVATLLFDPSISAFSIIAKRK